VALNIKDKETEALVAKIASLTGETETEAVRIAARERVERLQLEGGDRERRPDDPRRSPEAFRHWLETEIWSLLPPDALDREPMTKAEREELLGYGPDGV
jgi:antitoxin VapB